MQVLNSTRLIAVVAAGVVFALGGISHAVTIIPTTGTLLSNSKFNVPPYTSGVPVDGQGTGETGWNGAWHKLGGFNDRGNVVTTFAQEGNASVQLFADQVFGTSIEREWSSIVPVVRVDAYILVTPGAAMNAQVVTDLASTTIDPRRAGAFRIETSGLIDVFDKVANNFVSTGFFTLPNQWNKYSLIANTNTNTYSFLFNDQLFDSAHPLQFMNSMFYVDGINLRADSANAAYVDNISVTAVPEPTSIGIFAVGLGIFALAAWQGRIAN